MYTTCCCQCQSILFLISTWLLCIFIFYFTLYFLLHKRSFNISSIKAKRAVNRMRCVVQIVIGGLLKSPAGTSKRCICRKWVCDVGFGEPFTSNKSTEKIMEGRQMRFRDGHNSSTKRRPILKQSASSCFDIFLLEFWFVFFLNEVLPAYAVQSLFTFQ